MPGKRRRSLAANRPPAKRGLRTLATEEFLAAKMRKWTQRKKTEFLFLSLNPQPPTLNHSVIRPKHPVAKRSGHGDVEPDGKHPFREASMRGETIGQARDEGEENQRQTQPGQHDVADQQE